MQNAIPPKFPYAAVFLHGRPRHDGDDFSRAHPPMERGKRAKIFAPFDALDGYGTAIRTKRAVYVEKICLSADERAEINRRLSLLRDRIPAGVKSGGVLPEVRATYYVPCGDRNHDAFGIRGTYETVRGPCRSVDGEAGILTVGNTAIRFDDLLSVRSAGQSGRGKDQ